MSGTESVFEIRGPGLAGSRHDLFGLWTPAAPEESAPALAGIDGGTLAFAPGERLAEGPAAGIDEAPVWRANFSAWEQVAAHQGEAQSWLRASRTAVAVAPARLDAYVVRRPVGLAYAVPTPGGALDPPERELDLLLTGIQGGGPMMSFGRPGEFAQKWREAIDSFRSFAGHMRQVVADWAWVETRVAGNLVGQTRVTWGGDVRTVVAGTVDAEGIRLHQQTLELALASRQTALRTTALVIAGAVKLAATLATPVGVVGVVPVVLRFVEQLRIQSRERINKEAQNV